jgi:hypothetical protein
MIANLTGEITSKIRVGFGVVPDMTPTRVVNLSGDVGRMILDHMGQLHDVREITDENGFLLIPPPEATEPGSGGSWRPSSSASSATLLSYSRSTDPA